MVPRPPTSSRVLYDRADVVVGRVPRCFGLFNGVDDVRIFGVFLVGFIWFTRAPIYQFCIVVERAGVSFLCCYVWKVPFYRLYDFVGEGSER